MTAAAAALRGAGIGGPGRGRRREHSSRAGTLGDSAQRGEEPRVVARLVPTYPAPEEPSARRAQTPGRTPRAACALSGWSPGTRRRGGGSGRPREAGRDRGAGPAGPQGQARSRANRQVRPEGSGEAARRGVRAERRPGLGPGVVPASRTGFVTWESGHRTRVAAPGSPLRPPAPGAPPLARAAGGAALQEDQAQQRARGSELRALRGAQGGAESHAAQGVSDPLPAQNRGPRPPGGAARTLKPFVFTPREVLGSLLKLENRILQPQSKRDPKEGAGPLAAPPDGQALLEMSFVDKLLKPGKTAKTLHTFATASLGSKDLQVH
ncbi:translation initiation factor IF-2-like [Meles meles]|uniref:translation initiation factor IF-2-like n=1 Tax=Meles meles TaxID=9662 RepID=UPI001E69A0BC|nr:translation initiation factor IF-2-like [Meles meles]